jgi:predicted metal-dependent hydrolase
MNTINHNSKESGCFVYGEQTIHYEVLRKEKPRKVTIKVHPDKRVVAIAPLDASTESIQKAITKKSRWVWKHLNTLNVQKEHVLPRQYVSGETQFYLGRRYVLKVSYDNDCEPDVKLLRGKLTVTLKQAQEHQSQKVKTLINTWYIEHAKNIFNERLNSVAPKATWLTNIPPFRMRAMKKQWGSCSKKGILILNPHLVKAPKECIDYVILHELCHIAEHNHSEKFWSLLTRVMPGWKEIKYNLDEMAELYLNE